MKKIPGKLISNYIGKTYEFELPGWKFIHVTVKRKEGMKEARARLREILETERFGKIEIGDFSID